MSTYMTDELVRRFGPLLTADDLAVLLQRSKTGLQWSLGRSSNPMIRALHGCQRRVGRRNYYPADAVARILAGEEMAQ